MFTLIVDYREKDIIKELTDTKFETQNLDIGDIIIKKRDTGANLVLIERKTLADLASSIKDGRYREQKCRLKSSDFKRIIYLIEGNTPRNPSTAKVSGGMKYTTLESAMISMSIRDGFNILRSNNVVDSARQIKKIMTKMSDYISVLENTMNDDDDVDQYIKSVKLKKKENLTPMSCFKLQLAQIPGVSTSMAKCISCRFSNWPVLLEFMNNNEDKGQKILEQMCFGISDGSKQRKIGPVVSKRLVEYLFPKIVENVKKVEKVEKVEKNVTGKIKKLNINRYY